MIRNLFVVGFTPSEMHTQGSDQQKNMLIRGLMWDINFNIFEINELCMSTRITCDEPCEVVMIIDWGFIFSSWLLQVHSSFENMY